MASQEWHWEQANKYAVEAVKTTLVLNGAAAIALMTFATNTQKFSSLLIPLISFVIGAVLSMFSFFAAYAMQLYFSKAVGNESSSSGSPSEVVKLRKVGERWGWGSLVSVWLSVLAFGFGICWAASVLPQLAAAK